MDYILAKKLKDAGFPQEDRRCSNCKEQNHVSCTVCEDTVEAFPTLSQLIEACGDDFISLNKDSEGWICYFHDKEWNGDKDCTSWYSTPTEAVANLWLSLSAVSAPNNQH